MKSLLLAVFMASVVALPALAATTSADVASAQQNRAEADANRTARRSALDANRTACTSAIKAATTPETRNAAIEACKTHTDALQQKFEAEDDQRQKAAQAETKK